MFEKGSGEPSGRQLESDYRLVAGSQFVQESRFKQCGRTVDQSRTTSGLSFSRSLPSCLGTSVRRKGSEGQVWEEVAVNSAASRFLLARTPA